jgi:hypothetical protein
VVTSHQLKRHPHTHRHKTLGKILPKKKKERSLLSTVKRYFSSFYLFVFVLLCCFISHKNMLIPQFLLSMSRSMRSVPFQSFLLVMCLVVTVSSCTPSPNTNTHVATVTTGTATCAAAKNMNNNNNNNHNNNNNNNQIFGIPEAKFKTKVSPTTAKTTTVSSSLLSSESTTTTLIKQTIQELRGGELHEPETLQDTEALVLNAATNRKLLVIDFTASWW